MEEKREEEKEKEKIGEAKIENSKKEIEEKPEEKIEERAQKIKNWFKDPYKALFFAILVIALIIRLYYFVITKQQALWWDALCYGSIAKNLVSHGWDDVWIIIAETRIRPWLIPILWSFLIRLNASELISKFILEILPSFFTVFFTYLIAKKLYNKRIALIASFILAVSWIHIFYSMRMLVHIPAYFFSTAGLYLFLKAIETEKINQKYFSLAIFIAFLAVLARYTFAFVGIAMVLLLVLRRKTSFLKQKAFWIGGIIGSIPLFVFFIASLIKYGNIFPAAGIYTRFALSHEGAAFRTLDFFPHIFQTPFFIFFLAGLVILIAQLVLGFDLIFKVKRLQVHLFLLFLLVLNVSFLIFFFRYVEDRYLFECFLPMILIVGIGADYTYLFIKKYNKTLAVLFIIALIGFGGYTQLTYGKDMINSKKMSFYQMRQAFLWIKENTPQDSIIFSKGGSPYIIYYAERGVLDFVEENISMVMTDDFDYAVVHAFHQQSEIYLNYLDSIKENLTVVNSFFFDSQQQNPAVIIYKVLK